MQVELSKTRDEEAGGGTTLMIIVAGSLRFLSEAFSERFIQPSFPYDLTRVEKAKIGLTGFSLSASRTDTDNHIVVSDAQMGPVLRKKPIF
ncbi:hypothetical protein GH733_004355 [Mirounga leonina]|nr:hypothetical protein GH733_004355 [Mirounga leonina]